MTGAGRIVVGPRARRLLPWAFGLAILAATVSAVGTGPLVRGVVAVSPPVIVLAVACTAVATLAASWRWRTVSAALGHSIPWADAVAAYYRSQFVNTVLPTGVLGDVHRAYRQGSARAVVTERVAGQVVQGVVTVAVLGVIGLTGPLASLARIGAGALLLTAIALAVAVVSARGRRVVLGELSLLRRSLGSVPRAASVMVASVVVVAAHAATFVVACLAVGVVASPPELAGLALVALAAAAVPFSVGGWGPREAVSASVFAVIGLGAAVGLAASTAFGVLTFVSVLPGGAVLIADAVAARRAVGPRTPRPVTAHPEESPA